MPGRAALAKFIHSKPFSNTVIGLILLNAVTLGLETDAGIMASHGPLLHTIDHAVLWFFVAELSLRIYALRGSFFRGGWNLFDFAIVVMSLLPHVGPFSMLRTLRILRAFRLISAVPAMRKVVSAMISSIPGMASVISILAVVFYVAAVITTQVFGAVDEPQMKMLWGTIGDSMRTLFQVMTLDNWMGDVVMPTRVHFPNSGLFFTVFVMVTSFSVLNLFIGIIVDAMNILHAEDREDAEELARREHIELLRDIRAEMAKLAAMRKD